MVRTRALEYGPSHKRPRTWKGMVLEHTSKWASKTLEKKFKKWQDRRLKNEIAKDKLILERSKMRHHQNHNTEQRIRGDDEIQGISSDRLHVVVHPPLTKGYIKGSFCRTHDQYEVSAATSSGIQNSFTICHLGSMYDVLGSDAAAAGPSGNFQLPIALHRIIPDVAMPAQSYYSANTDPLTQKLAIKHVELECDIVNAGNYPAVVDVYVFKAKKNIPSTNIGANSYNLGDIVSIWGRAGSLLSQGVGPQTFPTAYGAGALGYQTISDPGAKPMNNSEFKKWYECLGAHSMNLGPGAVEKLNISIEHNLQIDVAKTLQAAGQNPSSTLLNQTAGYYNTGLLRGGIQVFCIFRGTPAKDSTVGNSGRFTYAPAEIGCIVQRKISYLGMKSNAKNYPVLLAKDNLATAIADSALAVMSNSNIAKVVTKEL